jgi:predicted transcriptional regulator
MATGNQIRAARALLGITAQELAELSGVGWATIQRFENSPGIPKAKGGTLERVVDALKEAGVEFLGDPIDSPGVRLIRKP